MGRWCKGEMTEIVVARMRNHPRGRNKEKNWDYQDLVSERRAELRCRGLTIRCCLASVGTTGLVGGAPQS